MKKTPEVKAVIIKANDQPIAKSDHIEQLDPRSEIQSSEWITSPYNLVNLKDMVRHSSILPQCIRAYKNNIAGFGIGVRYKEDVEENDEMIAEYTQGEHLLKLLNADKDTKEVFEDIIEARETYATSYLEVIRNIAGEVVQVEFVADVPSVEKTRRLEPFIEIDYFIDGELTRRPKKFRKYKQTLYGQTVYFKEFGDPRVMDKRDGRYLEEGETLELGYQANELLEFTIGSEPYGEVRWSGQILGVDGSRRAETLNNNYFRNGRHTPLMIIVKGGTLTDDSFAKLTDYMNGIKGEAGQHAFIVLESEPIDNNASFEESNKVEVEIKDLASVLQKDELFQEYLDNNRRRVQSAFLLPDLYVGYTTDFNRATSLAAMEVTEKQVFQPERRSLAWIINNKLLNGYNFKHIEFYFKEPDTSNPDDLFKLLSVANNAGGLVPNKAKEVLYEALGDNYEPFDGEWADMPIAIQKQQAAGFATQIEQQIAKAAAANDNEIVAVMKEVRKLLLDMSEEG